MDRLDYVSMMCNEHAYVMTIERLLGRVNTLLGLFVPALVTPLELLGGSDEAEPE
jgi:hypothetical protein